MTQRTLPVLGERQRDILAAVIHEYIFTALPVGSAALVRRYRLPVSSATVRNTNFSVASILSGAL